MNLNMKYETKQGLGCETSPGLNNSRKTFKPLKSNTLHRFPKQLQGQMKKSAQGKDHQVLEGLKLSPTFLTISE